MKFILSLIVILSVLPIARPSVASTMTGGSLLTQFNVIVLGSATSTSHVDGRTYIGGNLDGGVYTQHAADTPTSAYAGLTVHGSATNISVTALGAVIGGNLSSSIINSGASTVFGTAWSNTFNDKASVGTDGGSNIFNKGQDASLSTGTAATAAFSTDFSSILATLSSQIKNLSSTGSTVALAGSKATFTAVADSNGMAVFDLSAMDDSFFSTAKEFEFNLNGATTVLINSDVKDADLAANFLGGAALDIGSAVIWNFYDADTLDVQAQFGGSILAPNAALTTTANIEGSVYVASLTQNAEIHLQTFTGSVPSTPTPLPPALFLLGTGLACFLRAGTRGPARADL